MVKLDCLDLRGDALNWAVAKAVGFKPAKIDKWKMAHPDESLKHSRYYVDDNGYQVQFSKLIFLDWIIGGPLCERQKICVRYEGRYREQGGRFRPGTWKATASADASDSFVATGDTELEAKLRCLVFLKLGNVVEVPEELVLCSD